MTNKTLRLSGGNRRIIQLGVLAQKLFKYLKKYFKSQSFLKKKRLNSIWNLLTLQYSCLKNPMNSVKRQKDMTLKDELPTSVGAQHATWDQWRTHSRKNEEMEPKQKHHPVVDVTDDGSKVQCYKEQYCIGTWNVRSMNQGKLEVVKQEMERGNIDILGISELKWTGMGELMQMTIISTTVGKNPLEEME